MSWTTWNKFTRADFRVGPHVVLHPYHMLIYTIQYKNYKITKYINQNKLHLRCHWVAVEVDVQLSDLLLLCTRPLAPVTPEGDERSSQQVKAKAAAKEAHIPLPRYLFNQLIRYLFTRSILVPFQIQTTL